MTDDRDLHELAAPLLADPPHPPPPLDELERRVGRRRQRRARAIGLCSVVAVVLVAAGVLALPRDSELQVGDGTAATPTTQPPPPLEPGPVQLVVTPESAPVTTERNIEIRNTSSDDYTTCGTYDLFRWDGETWSPVVRVYFGGGGTMFGTYDLSQNTDECSWSPLTVAAGQSTNLGFDPDTSVWWAVIATAPPGTAPLADGWYELRADADGVDDRPLGRFEITDPAPAPSTSTTTSTGAEDEAPVSVDLYPLDLVPSGEILPSTVFVVDQDTIALAWTGGCNEPADRVTFDAHDGEIELRLHVGRFPVIDCMGEPDDWMVTFDVPFTITDRVRLVARAAGTEGEVDRVPGVIVGSVGGSSRLSDPTPTSFRVVDLDPSDPKLRDLRLLLPYPLVDAAVACDVSLSGHNTVMVPEVWIDPDAATSACSDEQLTVQLNPGTTVLGLG